MISLGDIKESIVVPCIILFQDLVLATTSVMLSYVYQSCSLQAYTSSSVFPSRLHKFYVSVIFITNISRSCTLGYQAQATRDRNYHFLALIYALPSHSCIHGIPIISNFRKATLQGHTVSLFLRPPLGLTVECPVHQSTSIVEAEDQDGDILRLLKPSFHSGLGVSRADSQAGGPGDKEAANRVLSAVA